MFYKNKDRKCDCYRCELNTNCPYVDKYQRLGRENRGALGHFAKSYRKTKTKEKATKELQFLSGRKVF